MVALLSFVALLLPVLLARTSPIHFELAARGQVYSQAQRAKYGVSVGNGVTRFVFKYADAQRWKQSTPVCSSEVVFQQDLPPACPQSGSSSTSEDCLYMVLYVPDPIGPGSDASTLFYFPGGSFITGSASDPLINGAQLAAATRSLIAVVQHRLGGFIMPPNGETNLAVNDVINALKVLGTMVPKIGGSASKITIAGHSSGGTMVRALLATPSAQSLFRSAILQSDPMDNGFLSTGTQQTMQNFFNGLLSKQSSCDPSEDSCASSLSVSDILTAADELYSQALSLDPAAGQGEPIRPVRDNKLIVHTLTSSSPFPQVSKPILVTTVVNEAGSIIYGTFDSPVSENLFQLFTNATLGSDRTAIVLASQNYKVQTLGKSYDARPTLEKLGTDYMWKCPSWTLSRAWTSNGGTAYVGMYVIGATHPTNLGNPFCTKSGSVCHQDDIQILFGTTSNPTAQQTQLTKEMQARYKAFLETGNPNAPGFAQWNPATSSSTNAILLGGSGPAPIGTCTPNFWGSAVLYDYQVFGL